MKRKVIALIILVVGLGFLSYPIVGNIINVVRQNSIQEEYNAAVEQLNEETKNQLKTEAEEYNQKLASGELSIISTDEDSIGEDYDDGSGYASALDVGTGSTAIAFIKIPKISVELPIYRGTNAVTLEKGIGHLRNTSLPVGGQSSHCVLTGHTGMPSSMLFTDLDKMEEGDMFYIQYLDEIHAYKVNQIKIVEPTDTSDLQIVQGKDYVTLLTCYPYGVNSHRLLVRGERVDFNGEVVFGESGNVETVTEKNAESTTLSETNTVETTATLDIADRETIISDLEKDASNMISIYGLYVPLWTVILVAALIVLFIVIAVIRRKRCKKKTAGIDDNSKGAK